MESFLRKMITNNKINILYYKQPRMIEKVNYKGAVKELWDTKISDDKDEDKRAKKTIANINIGLLEKSSNKHQDSKIFNSVREACYYQSLYGGKVYSISHQEEELVEDEDENITRVSRETGDKYYILNISDSKKLMNGFRPIKELLLQHHNFKMYETYETLKANGVRVYSVKSDAFTIHSDDVSKVAGYTFFRSNVGGCLDVGSEIGQWKVEDNSQQQNALGYNLSMQGIGTVAIDGPRLEEFLRSRKDFFEVSQGGSRKGGLARGSRKGSRKQLCTSALGARPNVPAGEL